MAGVGPGLQGPKRITAYKMQDTHLQRLCAGPTEPRPDHLYRLLGHVGLRQSEAIAPLATAVAVATQLQHTVADT